MGGSIKVESEQGRGSTFIVNLPMKLADTEAESKTRTENADLTKLDGKRVLICEDNDINAEIEKALLEKKGIASDRAVNGAEGVEKFATSPKHFYDAILMDVRMASDFGSRKRSMPSGIVFAFTIPRFTASLYHSRE